MASIEMVNHASVLMENDSVRLLTDPWLGGTAFRGAWDLLLPTKTPPTRLESASHLWISHEHPDHFSPKTLDTFTSTFRRRAKVITQDAEMTRLDDYIRQNGYQARIRLPRGQIVPLGQGFEVICSPHRGGDSWLTVRVNGHVILNLNDCVIRSRQEAASLHKRIGRIDVLLIKFSYGSWAGNPEDTRRRAKIAEAKLRDLVGITNTIRPAYVIPFASNFFFCHCENYYLNDLINSPRAAHDILISETTGVPVVLVPGQRWVIGERLDNEFACSVYDEALAGRPAPRSSNSADRIPLGTLKEAAMRTSVTRWLGRPYDFLTVRLWDLRELIHISLDGELYPAENSQSPDVELSSDSLLTCLQFAGGADLVRLGGRLHLGPNCSIARFVSFFT